MTRSNIISVDIETSGLGANSTIRAVGFRHDTGLTEIYYVGPNEELDIDSIRNDEELEFFQHNTEGEMLESVKKKCFTLNPQNVTLLMHNGESYRGGFDVPMLRTRCQAHGVDWVFSGLDAMDSLEIVQKKFNTAIPTFDSLNKSPLVEVARILLRKEEEVLGSDDEPVLNPQNIEKGTKSEVKHEVDKAMEEYDFEKAEIINRLMDVKDDLDESDLLKDVNGLAEAHEVLVGEEVGDSVDDSAEVATAEMDVVVRHLLADLRRTDDLRKVIEEYGWNGSYGLDSNIQIRQL